MHLAVFVKGRDRPERRNSYVNTAKMGKANISDEVVSVIFPLNTFPPVNLQNIEPDKSVFLQTSQYPPLSIFTEMAVN